MTTISQNQWKQYIAQLRKINDKAAEEFKQYVVENGGYENIDRQKLIDYGYGIATKYGEASASLSAEMYDAIAEKSGVNVLPAVPAETAEYSEVAKTVNGIIKNTGSEDILAQGIGRLVKMAGTDTMLSNAYRDRPKGKGSKKKHSGAQVAWIPVGDTCPFCLMLASKGWQNQTQWGAKNHSEHIHANCDCTYAVRFGNDLVVEGYDPAEYKKMYDNAEGSTREEKLNSMRRMQYAEHKEIVAQRGLEDVTSDYLKNAKPGKGTFKIDIGFEDKNGEEKTAEWLFNKFGGDIVLLPENNPEGISNPDYLWNTKLWDLKKPQTIRGVDKRVRHGLHQIANNSGGLVIDIKDVDASEEDIIKKITERIKCTAQANLDVILCNDLKLIKVLRYKK